MTIPKKSLYKHAFNNVAKTQEAFNVIFPKIPYESLKHWFALSKDIADQYSADPQKRVGSLIVSPDNELISIGVNNFPEGVNLTEERLNNRKIKYPLVLHSEPAAISACAQKRGAYTEGCLFVVSFLPCNICAQTIVNSKVAAIAAEHVGQLDGTLFSKWTEGYQFSEIIINESVNKPYVVPLYNIPAKENALLSSNNIPNIEKLVNGMAFENPIAFDALKKDAPQPLPINGRPLNCS